MPRGGGRGVTRGMAGVLVPTLPLILVTPLIEDDRFLTEQNVNIFGIPVFLCRRKKKFPQEMFVLFSVWKPLGANKDRGL